MAACKRLISSGMACPFPAVVAVNFFSDCEVLLIVLCQGLAIFSAKAVRKCGGVCCNFVGDTAEMVLS